MCANKVFLVIFQWFEYDTIFYKLICTRRALLFNRLMLFQSSSLSGSFGLGRHCGKVQEGLASASPTMKTRGALSAPPAGCGRIPAETGLEHSVIETLPLLLLK